MDLLVRVANEATRYLRQARRRGVNDPLVQFYGRHEGRDHQLLYETTMSTLPLKGDLVILPSGRRVVIKRRTFVVDPPAARCDQRHYVHLDTVDG